MNKHVQRHKIIKGLTILALSTSVVFGSIGQNSIVTKANSYSKAEDLLANLTSAQRAALHQLSTTDETGLKISSDINLSSAVQTPVIVEFVNKPAKIARLEASIEGKQLPEAEANNLVEHDHETFKQDLQQLADDNKKVDFKIKRTYKNAFNGVSMSLPANQISKLLKLKAVKKVWSNQKFTIDPPPEDDKSGSLKTDESNIANYTPFDGVDRLHAEGFTGKGIKIGILDTGIDYNHPDLKDAYKGGYDFIDNDNDPMETTYEDWKKSGEPEFDGTSAYYTEHGTHVAGIIAGQGVADSEYKKVGVAPDADIYAYRVLGPYGGGDSDGIIAAIDQAVKDGMDVINMSLGATINNPLFPTSIAVNNAVISGVTTVVAAGNSGDNMYTVGAPGTAALALTVGASSVAINLYQYAGVNNNKNYLLRQMAQNYLDDLTTLKGKTYQLVDVGLGNMYNFTGKDVKGKIAFIKRGSIALMDKIKNAKANGAAGVIMYNDEANKSEGAIKELLGESMDAIPTFSISNEDGLSISASIKEGKSDFTFGDFSKLQTASDDLANFSSRGPSRINYDIKPELTAPGVSILSTVPFYINDKTVDGTKAKDYQFAYERLSGTSMATPYVTGVSALLLQSNKDLTPSDVKSILMNTADPLSKAYSVFEVGSGRVDAYEAIHSNVELIVKDKTPNMINGKQKFIEELTGGMSFGSFSFNDQDISDSRNITLKNRSEKAKTFNVNVKFQTGQRGSKDAALNNVTLSGPTSIKLNGISQKSVKFDLNIPKTAEKGTYEGYVVFTNNEDQTEQYQIPFGVRVVNEGIESFKVENPLFSTDYSWPETMVPFLGFSFELKSHLKTLDVVIQDPTTGQDLGLVGSFDALQLNENQSYFIPRGFSTVYYPFTGDSKNPISSETETIKTGHYKLRLVGSNENGKIFSAASDFLYELGAPSLTSSFDHLEQKVIEYNNSQLDSNGQFLYDFNINVKDPEVEEANRYGISVDQSSNSVVSFFGGFPANPINTDKNGNYTDQILVNSQFQPLQFQFYGMDAAKNPSADASNMLKVVFVEDTYPYYYLKANKQNITTGDTVNYSVRSNNIKNLKTTKISLPVFSDQAEIENVKVNAAVKQYGEANVTVTTAPTNWPDVLQYTFTFNYLGNKQLPEDLQLFNFDIKTLNKYMVSTPFSWHLINSTTIDQSNVETGNVYTYMEGYKTKTTISKLEGSLSLEGTMDPSTSQTNVNLDQRSLGAKVTVSSYDNKTIVEAPINNQNGVFEADGFKAEKNDYTIKVDVPGHFTMYKQVNLSDEVRGELVGKDLLVAMPIAAAGDSNKDNVIDILDALAVQTYWGTNKATADFNFDKVVDKKDMDFIIKNFGLQNKTVQVVPKAKTTYKGETLDSILEKLGLSK
ncbi:S8 family serine peptidase [Gottfriedia sp. NPDC056225]|uniref:S8 family serine peptidase n=1 Tax=Gottfriedia sp. NPDC056225 TaxID=3345751 RepID=UPI0035DFB43F